MLKVKSVRVPCDSIMNCFWWIKMNTKQYNVFILFIIVRKSSYTWYAEFRNYFVEKHVNRISSSFVMQRWLALSETATQYSVPHFKIITVDAKIGYLFAPTPEATPIFTDVIFMISFDFPRNHNLINALENWIPTNWMRGEYCENK